jgi:hypothetical protein
MISADTACDGVLNEKYSLMKLGLVCVGISMLKTTDFGAVLTQDKF